MPAPTAARPTVHNLGDVQTELIRFGILVQDLHFEDFGAIGDDSTDNTDAINRCLAVANAAPYGAKCIFGPGAFRTQGGHTWGQKVTVSGQGVTGTIARLTANAICFMPTAPGVTNERIGISDILIDATGAGVNGTAVEIRDVNFGAFIHRVRVTNFTSGVALRLHNFATNQYVEGVQLLDFSFANNATAIQLKRTNGTNSFNFQSWLSVYGDVPAGGTFLNIGGGTGNSCVMYHSFLNVKANLNNAANTILFDIETGSQVYDSWLYGRCEATSGTSIVLRTANNSSTVFVPCGGFAFGSVAAANFSIGAASIVGPLLNPPTQSGGSSGLTAGEMALGIVAPGAGAALSPALKLYAFNGTNPERPGTLLDAFTKEGYIKPFVGQANEIISSGRNTNNILEWRDANSLEYSVSGHRVDPTYGSTVTPDVRSGDYQRIVVTNGTAFTIANPAGGNSDGQKCLLEVFNNSGGAMGVVSWGTFWVPNGFVAPGNGLRTHALFVFENSNNKWRQISPWTTAI